MKRLKQYKPLLEENFSSVGISGNYGLFMRESFDQFRLFCSGRKNCRGMLFDFKVNLLYLTNSQLKKRQDLFSLLLDFITPVDDILVPLPSLVYSRLSIFPSIPQPSTPSSSRSAVRETPNPSTPTILTSYVSRLFFPPEIPRPPNRPPIHPRTLQGQRPVARPRRQHRDPRDSPLSRGSERSARVKQPASLDPRERPHAAAQRQPRASQRLFDSNSRETPSSG